MSLLPISAMQRGFCVLVIGLFLSEASAIQAHSPQPPGQSQPTARPRKPAARARRRPAAPKPPANSNSSPTPNEPLPQIDKMEQEDVARGGSVTFTGQNFPGKTDDITVYLNNKASGKASVVSSDKKTFIFVLPDDIALGRYSVKVDFKINNASVPFTPKMPVKAVLTVYGEAGKIAPKITAVNPLIGYPEKEVYGFVILGEGFSTKGTDNGLVIENQGEIANICWADDPECKSDDLTRVHGKVINDRQLIFSGIPQKQQVTGIRVRVGHQYSDPFAITLSRVGRQTPVIMALLVFVALFGILLLLTSMGMGASQIAGKRFGVLTALFLDHETNTYSLSRFQFFIWTAVAIFGYLYLMLSRSLVQWKLEFVDVPAGLPAIILISASTTMLAQGITNSKGPKGAGEIHPGLADFVSVGGIVVPERFQFFIWTLLGAVAFVFLMLLNDPGTIKDLPQVPAGFLELMGVSSLGYLGGKLARKPGPVVDEITAKQASLELTIRGRGLSQDAGFQIGNDVVSSDNIEGAKPKIIEADDQTGERNMAKVLLLIIKDPKPEWLNDDARLTIINPDGQRATWAYKVDKAGPVVNSIQAEVNDQRLVITVKGSQFDKNAQIALYTNEGQPWPDQPTVNFTAPDTLVIQTSATNQPGKVTITNPDKRFTSAPFKVSVQA